MFYLAHEGEDVVDLPHQVLSFFRKTRVNDLKSRMSLCFLEGDDAVVRLKLFLGTGQFGRIDPPKGFDVLEYLVILVG
jgi:hypothetical protein